MLCKFEIECFYLIPAISSNELSEQYITVDVYGSEFVLALNPLIPDCEQILNEFEENNWIDKFAKKAGKAIFSSLKKNDFACWL